MVWLTWVYPLSVKFWFHHHKVERQIMGKFSVSIYLHASSILIMTLDCLKLVKF